ncbi:hypothetical protein BDQ17DRAFT_616504 [Cyathus striatus]|nr:hypothetical protein BDQ17DRAFT_616504 [Cyathus striatus]
MYCTYDILSSFWFSIVYILSYSTPRFFLCFVFDIEPASSPLYYIPNLGSTCFEPCLFPLIIPFTVHSRLFALVCFVLFSVFLCFLRRSSLFL